MEFVRWPAVCPASHPWSARALWRFRSATTRTALTHPSSACPKCWAIGFPTAGLAWAAILYDATVQTAATKVLATSLMALACIVCVTLVFRTLTGIARFKVRSEAAAASATSTVLLCFHSSRLALWCGASLVPAQPQQLSLLLPFSML